MKEEETEEKYAVNEEMKEGIDKREREREREREKRIKMVRKTDI
jgi:hypothetical protein